jgi:site-specific recombinase XerD
MTETKDWPSYDRFDIDQRRLLLSSFLRSPEAQDIAADIERFFPANAIAAADLLRPHRHNTDRAYQADQRAYVEACAKANVDPLAPSPEFWVAYFTQLATSPSRRGIRRRYRSLVRVAYGIANLFRVHGLPSPVRTRYHRSWMRQLARYDDRATKKARPLYGSEAERLVRSYDRGTIRGLRDCSISVIGSTRGFRSATIVGIQVENVTFEQRGVVFGLRDEKASLTRELDFTGTPHTHDHRACVPCILRDHVEVLRALGIDSGPLFRPIDRWGHMGASGLSTKSVTTLLREGLERAGIENAAAYSSHSYRHGVVKTAVKRRLSLEEIMSLTLHRSVRGLRAYIEDIDPWYNAPRKLPMDSVIVESDDHTRGWRHESA